MAFFEGSPSFSRFSFEALATADLHSARITGYREYDLERSVAAVVQISHEAGRSSRTVTSEGRLAWITSTVVLPLEWRGHCPDCSVLYTVKETPTRYYVERVHFGDAGSVYAAYAVISAYS